MSYLNAIQAASAHLYNVEQSCPSRVGNTLNILVDDIGKSFQVDYGAVRYQIQTGVDAIKDKEARARADN